jgi:hypothetical protein
MCAMLKWIPKMATLNITLKYQLEVPPTLKLETMRKKSGVIHDFIRVGKHLIAPSITFETWHIDKDGNYTGIGNDDVTDDMWELITKQKIKYSRIKPPKKSKKRSKISRTTAS